MRNNLDITSLVLQVYSLIILLQDYNNGDLMQELHLQDEMYLKTIIKQNNEKIKLLKERSETDGRKVNRKG